MAAGARDTAARARHLAGACHNPFTLAIGGAATQIRFFCHFLWKVSLGNSYAKGQGAPYR